MDNEIESSVTTSVAVPIDCSVDGYIILEVSQLWSDLRYRFGTDDRRNNLSFAVSGMVLVAIPTRDNPPPPPAELDGIRVNTLEEYLYAVMKVVEANETVRFNVYQQLQNKSDF